jgi:hypothetical protein
MSRILSEKYAYQNEEETRSKYSGYDGKKKELFDFFWILVLDLLNFSFEARVV